MESNNAEIQHLRDQLADLYDKQKRLIGDVRELNAKIEQLKESIDALKVVDSKEAIQPKVEVKPVPIVAEKVTPVMEPAPIPPVVKEKAIVPQPQPKPTEKSSMESFLGENLASKIGIAVILIGIGVGVKYAIDKNLLGPLMRISLGYLAGALLIGFGLISKKKYENLSAVMFAGGMAASYFVTFIAYDFYALIPKLSAFGLMVAFTVVTCVAAIRYDKQVIAIVGLVGAYAVPFLMSDGTGKALHLYIYVTIINLGILYLSFRKVWDSLYFVAFGCTWLVFIFMWLSGLFDHAGWDVHSLFGFLCVIYVLFYAILVINNLHRKTALMDGDIAMHWTHSVFAFLFGTAIVDQLGGSWYINGIFALVFAASHLLVAIILKMRLEVPNRLYYFALGFALMFATASVPMFFEVGGITVVWSVEAAFFFWLGRRKNFPFLEKVSFIPLVLSVVSILLLWEFEIPEDMRPLINPIFFTGLVFSAAFLFIAGLNYFDQKKGVVSKLNPFYSGLAQTTLCSGLIALYLTIGVEMYSYWLEKYHYALDDEYFCAWMLIFSMVYVGVIQLLNRYYVKNRNVAIVTGAAGLMVLMTFLTLGLYNLSEQGYMFASNWYEELEIKPIFGRSLRYLSHVVLVFMLFATWFAQRSMNTTRTFRRGMEIVFHVTFVWICCAELVHFKQINGGGDLYRAGLTIFGGSYSFVLIGYGIWKKKPHLRKLALLLFGVTLIKLFAYDLARVDSGSKTIAFISLGVLLLVISFLYTKYKDFILDDDAPS